MKADRTRGDGTSQLDVSLSTEFQKDQPWLPPSATFLNDSHDSNVRLFFLVQERSTGSYSTVDVKRII
jgi:hypothetical protein